MSSALVAALAGGRPPGLYRIGAGLRTASLERWARAHGWRLYQMDAGQAPDKAAFIRLFGAALGFPAYSAANWDAFEESLLDLSWAPAPGYVVLVDHPDRLAAADPAAWATARSILADASAHWRQRGVALFILFRRAGRSLPDLPRL